MVTVTEKINRPHRARDSVNGAGNFAADFLQSNAQSSFLADSYGSVAQETSGSITKNYTYRADGKISGFMSSSVQAGYYYDALDRIIAKSIQSNSSSFTHSYLHQADEFNIIAGKAGNGEIFTYIPGQAMNEKLGEVSQAGSKYYVTDHLGSVLNSEAAGAAKTFGIFGETSTSIPLTANTNPAIFSYTGHMYFPESDTYQTMYRPYDAKTGRWNSREPLGIDGPNFYLYASNNSQKYVDESGLFAIPGAIYGGISGFVGGYIASGGSYKAAFIGGAAGATVGIFNPFLSAHVGAVGAAAITGAAASATGQVVSNVATGKKAFNNFSVGAVVGSAVGGSTATGIIKASGIATTITTRILLAASEGTIGAAGELVGANIGLMINGYKIVSIENACR